MFNLMVMTPLQFKQECIPVGCVPPARYHTGVSGGGGGGRVSSLSGGLCPRGSPSVGICLGGSLSRAVSVQGGVSIWGGLSGGVSVRGVSVQGDLCPGGLPDRPPSLCEQNDRQTGVKTVPPKKLSFRFRISLSDMTNYKSADF